MEWSNHFTSFVSSSTTDPFLYPYNFDHFQGDQLKHAMTMTDTLQAPLHLPISTEKIISSFYGGENNNSSGQEKKKKMTREQLKMLERSFQEEIKLDPERKMKLSKELGLQPRQIAVWFQNRRARWRNKQLEHLYESLLREFDVICREKQMLQEEVTKLESILRQSGLSSKLTWNANGEARMGETETMKSTLAIGFDSSQPLNGNYAQKNREVILVEDHNYAPTASPTWLVFP